MADHPTARRYLPRQHRSLTMTETTIAHLCVGSTCWTCGEPIELRDMRHSIASAIHDARPDLDAHVLARVAADAIRGDVLDILQARGDSTGA